MSITKQKSQISFARSNWGPSNCWCWWRSLVKLRHSTIEIFPWKKKCQRRIYFPVYIQIRPLFKVINPKYINTSFYSMYLLGIYNFAPFYNYMLLINAMSNNNANMSSLIFVSVHCVSNFFTNYLAHVIEQPNFRIPNPQYFVYLHDQTVGRDILQFI